MFETRIGPSALSNWALPIGHAHVAARLLIALTLWSLFIGSASVEAANRFWVTSGDAFGVPGTASPNWSTTNGGVGGATVPSTADVAKFTDDAAYTVSFGNHVNTAGLDVENGQVTFDLNGKTYVVTVAADIGNIDGQTGQLVIVEGRLRVDSQTDRITLGGTSNATGSLTVAIGGQIGEENLSSSQANLVVGEFGTGSFIVQDDGSAFLRNLTLGEQPSGNGVAIVSGNLAKVDVASTILIGGSGHGELAILNRAEFISRLTTRIGDTTGSSGELTVSGVGSRWNGSMTVGRAGVGEFNITSGALVRGNATLGEFVGGNGTVAVSGTGTYWDASSMTVGRLGVGDLTIADGAQVGASFTGGASIGGASGGTTGNGHASVTGLGTRWAINGTLSVAISGSGELDIENGAVVTSLGGTIGTGHPGNTSATGSVVVRGNGSIWESGTLTVGQMAKGTLLVDQGAEVRSNSTTLGSSAGSEGTATVDGVGSVWDMSNAGQLVVGYRGSGKLTVQNGGTLYSGPAISSPQTYIAQEAGSIGEVLITGSGSTWVNRSRMQVGSAGNGSLTVSNGAHVRSLDTFIGTGAVLIDGPGSTLINESNYGFAAGSVSVGIGTLTITNGGRLQSSNGSINVGTVTISGLGSEWINDDDISVSNGTLNVLDGGQVSDNGTIFVSNNGILSGNGLVSATVSNSGVIAPGASSGTLQISGSYQQTSIGKVHIEIASNSSFDKLAVMGDVLLAGTLQVSLIENYAPPLNTVFDILDWSSLDGTFNAINLPILDSGLGWDTSQLYTTGTLSVVAGIPGDFDFDGDVDGRDFLIWQRIPSVGNLSDWQTNYGVSALTAASTAVPEPNTFGLLFLISLILAVSSRPAYISALTPCAC
jgi:T5SS/PEP-CTERM-associated repeat protein